MKKLTCKIEFDFPDDTSDSEAMLRLAIRLRQMAIEVRGPYNHGQFIFKDLNITKFEIADNDPFLQRPK